MYRTINLMLCQISYPIVYIKFCRKHKPIPPQTAISSSLHWIFKHIGEDDDSLISIRGLWLLPFPPPQTMQFSVHEIEDEMQ